MTYPGNMTLLAGYHTPRTLTSAVNDGAKHLLHQVLGRHGADELGHDVLSAALDLDHIPFRLHGHRPFWEVGPPGRGFWAMLALPKRSLLGRWEEEGMRSPIPRGTHSWHRPAGDGVCGLCGWLVGGQSRGTPPRVCCAKTTGTWRGLGTCGASPPGADGLCAAKSRDSVARVWVRLGLGGHLQPHAHRGAAEQPRPDVGAALVAVESLRRSAPVP